MDIPWKVEIASSALTDLQLICSYITLVLNNPIAAMSTYESIISSFNSLQEFPKRFRIREEMQFEEQKVRSMIVKNYLILYTVIDETHTVSIIHILNGKQNIENI
ncbi:MAG: type II toxin-antitoxin system RelE/ParE family toxin [Oscillospiraceae bacterium]|nr:type II toxin-antitoxin system RelE/ParE family toxin [Candidatus Limimonas egerieequi]